MHVRGNKVVETHKTHVRTIDQLRSDQVTPLDCCYKNKFIDYCDSDFIVVGLEADPENIARFCEELVDGCKIRKNVCINIDGELDSLFTFGVLRDISAGLQIV